MLGKKIRIIFLGTPEISAHVLKKIIDSGYNVVAVISQTDKPSGRKMILKPTPVKEVALSYGIPVFQPEKLNLDFDFINQFEPDLLLTMAYGQIISEKVLSLSKLPPLNLHASLLPKYRGASPIQAALLNGDKETGVSLMEMVKKMDAGRVFGTSKIEISDDDNFDSLAMKIVDASFEVFDRCIEDIANGINAGVEQDENLVTFVGKIGSEDQVIDFKNDGQQLVNKIRALNSEPGTYFVYKDTKYKVGKAKYVKCERSVPGRVKKYDKNGFFVDVNDGYIDILEIQKPGKKMMPIKDFFNGNQNLFVVDENIGWLK